MKNIKFIALMCIAVFGILSDSNAQQKKYQVEIVRDQWGVPHIFGKTDADVAYGLAWAHAEDDFKTIQQAYLAGNALLSRKRGLKGAVADYVAQLIGSEEIVNEKYESDISPAYKTLTQAYAEGLNRYAHKNPKEVIDQKLFPLTPKKMLRYQQLQLFFFSRGDYWASRILSNQLNDPEELEEMRGSNTFAFNSVKTKEDATYLAINTHQPLDGPASWYEAHLVSEEGTNILGALFAGSPNILTGANEHLAWSHTVNYPDKFDVFKLKMDPKKKHTYWVDGKAYPLEVHKAKVYIRILGIPIKVSRKYYKSMFGPTLKNDNGYYAMRTPAFYNIQALQQWWNMNKAQNFTEFYEALKMKSIPGFNIGYADKNDTIFYISNGLIPKRAPGYNWKEVVPGDTKKTLWTETYDIEELPQVIQPKSGYIYNANHSPFYASSESDNPSAESFSKDMNFETYHNNRSTRLYELINGYSTIGDQEFKKIKYDRQFPKPFQFNYVDINAIDSISAGNYPELSVLINEIQNWDRKADIDSYGAGAFASLYFELQKIYSSLPKDKKVTEEQLITALKKVKEDLQTYFGAERIQLGDMHRLIRGEKDIPIWGMPDVITAMGSVKLEDGRRKVVSGESYIELVKFTSEGVEIESVISYGSSDHSDSPHYNDQMELYRDFKTKKMTLDKAEIYRNAKKIYSPD